VRTCDGFQGAARVAFRADSDAVRGCMTELAARSAQSHTGKISPRTGHPSPVCARPLWLTFAVKSHVERPPRLSRMTAVKFEYL
jgi:hypothetical protein